MKFNIKMVFICGLLCAGGMAQAQTTLPANTEINLKVSLSEAETLWKALRKLSVEEVEQLMGKIRQQVSEQTQPKPVENKPVVPSPEPEK